MAASAAPISVSASVPSPIATAMPTLAVTKTSLPATLKVAARRSITFCATSAASSVRHVGEHDGELVAADARYRVAVAHRLLQPQRHLLQQLVAAGVAQGVVDRLEAVEVDEQRRERHIAALGLHDDLRKVVGEQRAVGQPGQRVELGEVGRRFSLSMRCSAVDSTLATASAKFSSSAANAFGVLYAAHSRPRTPLSAHRQQRRAAQALRPRERQSGAIDHRARTGMQASITGEPDGHGTVAGWRPSATPTSARLTSAASPGSGLEVGDRLAPSASRPPVPRAR